MTNLAPAPSANTAPAAAPTTSDMDALTRLPLVTVRDLRVAYDETTVLDGVDLDLHPGEMVALLGASGSGKSTLMRGLTGFAPITGGTARVAGHDVTNLRRGELRQLRAGVGQVFQQFNLIPRLSVLTNVLTGALHSAGPINLSSVASAASTADARWNSSTASASPTRRKTPPVR